MIEGVNLTKVYYKHICKYHNVSPCTTIIYQLKILSKNIEYYLSKKRHTDTCINIP
jgi:hypothetical protein